MMEMVTPHLKSVLKNYQHSATKSLQGPGLSLVQPKREIASPEVKEECGANDSTSSYGNNLQPPPPPAAAARFPVLTAPDTGRSERTETILEGVSISCFVVGGEKRLCLPQVLNSVLHEFTLPQINQECDQLQIFCSRCTPEQLNELKSNGILPSTAPSCGLITKTDAERLCSALLHCNAPVLTGPRSSHLHKDALSFRVYHECFGKCKGSCLPDLFTARDARCIECLECQGLYSPQQFVCHVHRDLENRTCHWGFDSTNWRAYLKIAKDQLDKEKMEGVLDVMREQYDGTTPFPPAASNNHKRKQMHHLDIDPLRGEVLDSLKQDLLDIPPKKLKLEEFAKSKLDDYTKTKLDDYAKSKQDEYSKSKLGNYAAYIYAASMSPLYINAALQWSNHHQLPPCYPLPSLKDGYQHGLMKDGYQAAIPKELLHAPIKQEAGVHQTIKQENTHIKENHNASYIKDNLQIHQDSNQHHHHHTTILRESSSQIRQNSTDKFIGQPPHNHHSNILHQKKYRHKMSPVDESRTGDDKDYERRPAAMDVKETVITQPANMTEKSSVSVVQSTEVSVIAREPYPVLMSHNEIYNPNNAHVDIRNNRSVITESNVSLNHQPSTSGVQNKLGYNPEIELSTDTDDSFSDASGETAKKELLESNKTVQQINAVEMPTHRPVIAETPVTSSNKNYNHQNIYLMQIEKLLLSTNEDVKTEVLNIAKFLASENSRLEMLSRQKDEIISSQQERISKLECQINVNSEESVVSASPDRPRCNGLSVVSPDRESSQERVTSSNGDMVQENGSPKPVESDSPVPSSKSGSPPATLATAKNDEAIMIKIEPE